MLQRRDAGMPGEESGFAHLHVIPILVLPHDQRRQKPPNPPADFCPTEKPSSVSYVMV